MVRGRYSMIDGEKIAVTLRRIHPLGSVTVGYALDEAGTPILFVGDTPKLSGLRARLPTRLVIERWQIIGRWTE